MHSRHERSPFGFCGIVLLSSTVGCATAASVQDTPPPVEGPQQVATSAEDTIPVGQQLDVRLQSSLSSDSASVEDTFTATTLVDLRQGNEVLVPAGSAMRGVVESVQEAGRLDRKGRLMLSFDRLTVGGETFPVRATAVDAFESEGIRGEAGEIGAGAGVGAIVGGLIGGFKGALTGILVGAGGVIAATEGEDVELPAGTIVRTRFDSPVTLE